MQISERQYQMKKKMLMKMWDISVMRDEAAATLFEELGRHKIDRMSLEEARHFLRFTQEKFRDWYEARERVSAQDYRQ